MAKMVQYVSAPVLSPVIGPPLHCCFCLSLRVRSLLTASHVCPPSVVLSSTLAPWYTAPVCCETRIGAVHWKRYLCLAGSMPLGLYWAAEMFLAWFVRRSNRVMMPPYSP